MTLLSLEVNCGLAIVNSAGGRGRMEISIISHCGQYEQCWAGRRVVAGGACQQSLLLEGTSRYKGRIRVQAFAWLHWMYQIQRWGLI